MKLRTPEKRSGSRRIPAAFDTWIRALGSRSRPRDAVTRRDFSHVKPWDTGDGQVVATFGEDGRLLALSRAHTRHGWIHLAGFPPFDEGSRYDPGVVRAYRKRLAEPRGARAPEWTWRGAGIRAAWRPSVSGGALRLSLTVERASRRAPDAIDVEFEADLTLARAAYAQITEGGPLPAPPAPARGRGAAGGLLWTSAPLRAWARLVNGGDFSARGAVRDAPAGVHRLRGAQAAPAAEERFRWRVQVPVRAGGAAYALAAGIGEGRAPAHVRVRSGARGGTPPAPLRRGTAAWWIERNVAFALDACAVRQPRGRCLITDPVLLPLCWTRDAYYIACLLGAVSRRPHPRREEAREAVRGAVHWMFEICERSGGFWGRSALTGGRTKDRAYQLDQQWYPLLLLARAAREWEMPGLWRTHRDAAFAVTRALLATRDPRIGLFPTTETPADDPLDLPFHFSSHVLAWRALTRLSSLPGAGRLAPEADALRARVEHAFAAGVSRGYAYAIDGRGRARAYHDANDVPTACAARWGFCAPDHPPWRAMLRFAWSRANGAYFPGRFGGLGSDHAPSPWTLDDVQRWIVAHAAVVRVAGLHVGGREARGLRVIQVEKEAGR
jgi:hypothetical protein